MLPQHPPEVKAFDLTPTKKSASTSGESSSSSISPAQIFDMAAEDEETVIQPTLKEHEETPQNSGRFVGSPAGSLDTCSEFGARDAWNGGSEQIDAWSMEDWDSPTKTPSQSHIEKGQQEVADAVRAGLQVDLEAFVHRTVAEIHSWVSEEIAFARQGFKDEFQKQQSQDFSKNPEVEQLRKEVEEQRCLIQKLQEEKVEKMQTSLDEQMRSINRLKEDFAAMGSNPDSNRDRETRHSASSDRVREAQMVADERKWRLKIEQLRTALDKSLESIEALEKKSSDMNDRSVSHDNDIQRCNSATQKLDLQLIASSKAQASLQASLDKCLERLDSMEKLSHDLTHRGVSQEMLDRTLGDVDSFKAKFDEVHNSLTSIEAGLQKSEQRFDQARSHLDERIFLQQEDLAKTSSMLAELQSELRIGQDERSLSTKKLDALCIRLELLSDKATSHDDDVHVIFDAIQKLESKSNSAEQELLSAQELIQKLDALSKTLAHELSEAKDAIQKLETASKMAADQLSITQGAFQKLEKDLSATKSLAADELARIKAAQQESAEKIQCIETDVQRGMIMMQKLDSQITSSEKDLAAQKTGLQEQSKSVQRFAARSEALEQNLEIMRGDLETTNAEIVKVENRFVKEGKQRLTELEALQSKVNGHDDTLKVLSNQLRSQLRGIRQSFGKSLNELSEEIFGKLSEAFQAYDSRADGMGAELKLHQEEMCKIIRNKADSSELLRTQEALQTWIDETSQTLRTWLGKSLDQFRGEQHIVLSRHETWIRNMSGWVEQVRVREQGLSHLIFYIVEQGSPEMVKLLEEALKISQVPKLEPMAK